MADTALEHPRPRPERRLLLLVQEAGETRETFALRLDIDILQASPAPAWKEPPPPEPREIPPDDPAWIARLRALPANVWVRARPPREPERRDWGNLACDPVRGLVVSFGGGHATYQVNDIAIYAPGATRWVHEPGDHDAPVPPIDWDGCTMGLRGGPPAGHQRNAYVAIDGRTFVASGTHSRRWDPEWAKEDGIRVAWFHDLDRGGAWRQREIAKVDLGPGVPGTYGRVQMADPAGRVLGFGGHLEPYDGRFFRDEGYFSSYDIYRNELSVRKIPAPAPEWVGECRPFCYVTARDAVLFHEWREGREPRTWLYSVAANHFTLLATRRSPPPGLPIVVESIDGQGAVFAFIAAKGGAAQWIYSFAREDWAPLPLRTEGGKMGFQDPYGQTVWSEKYGVLINLCGETWLMRPELPAAERP